MLLTLSLNVSISFFKLINHCSSAHLLSIMAFRYRSTDNLVERPNVYKPAGPAPTRNSRTGKSAPHVRFIISSRYDYRYIRRYDCWLGHPGNVSIRSLQACDSHAHREHLSLPHCGVRNAQGDSLMLLHCILLPYINEMPRRTAITYIATCLLATHLCAPTLDALMA